MVSQTVEDEYASPVPGQVSELAVLVAGRFPHLILLQRSIRVRCLWESSLCGVAQAGGSRLLMMARWLVNLHFCQWENQEYTEVAASAAGGVA